MLGSLVEEDVLENVYLFIQDKVDKSRAFKVPMKLPKSLGMPVANDGLLLPYTTVNGFMFRKDQEYRVSKVKWDYVNNWVELGLLRVEDA